MLSHEGEDDHKHAAVPEKQKEAHAGLSLPGFVCTLSPGAVIAATSGTTNRVPTNTISSPARADSTILFRRMTSIVRGRLPAGTCMAPSVTQYRWQTAGASANWLLQVNNNADLYVESNDIPHLTSLAP